MITTVHVCKYTENTHTLILHVLYPMIYSPGGSKSQGGFLDTYHHLSFAKLRNEVPLLVSFDHAWIPVDFLGGFFCDRCRGLLKPLQVQVWYIYTPEN